MSANKIGLTQSSLVARRLVSFIYSDTARYGFSTDHTAHVAPHGPLNNPPVRDLEPDFGRPTVPPKP